MIKYGLESYGMVWSGIARKATASQGLSLISRQGKDSEVRRGCVLLGKSRHGKARILWLGQVRYAMVPLAMARFGQARSGKARILRPVQARHVRLR